ncbi:DEHA2G07964p [Debaryomyces hansenii CBS767]|uniref:DEHA2G07964p n=1 Tax=Debaryomyces hansenii (strain ATCC 36239 / CBS 767 / BCRC 21394 / JCM 1990 / NBRC 0083 / IGC 2968) TaxID=284592 RepID=Q6BIS7_DEBHA|nr:DEHA2G07964p [Debaryomyces hansenii CBS767]CAG90357.1 DEHA2G07964p [Debaryomyces hansenii CBS767]|eukprot:XP_461894.1 DEHA2G07964p [Debaryomyces hansenii CBS767]
MKLHFITLTTLITACCAASIPVDTHKEVNLFKELDLNMSGADALDIEKVAATGLTDLLSKGKKAFSLVNVLKDVLGMISKIDQIQDSEEMGLAKRDFVEDLLVKVFVALKKSGLVNSIVKMSLTDCDVRPAIIDILIELLEADVIPWEEIFVALKDSGLAVDVINDLFTDPETREGLVQFTAELIPDLLASGALSGKDFCVVPSARIQLINSTIPNFK